MLLTLAALGLGGLFGLATGGKFRHAAHRRIAWSWLLLVGFGLEVAADRWLDGTGGYLAMVAGPLCLVAWAARNSRLAGVWLIALGLLANTLVLAVDRGMPVERAAMVRSGIVAAGDPLITVSGHRHHLASPADHLRFLDDRITLGGIHEVFSVGDLILAVGAADLVLHLLWYQPRYQRSRWRSRWGLGGELDQRVSEHPGSGNLAS